ncbi:peptidoglycan-binding protein [Tissierella sp. MB52-C2]|uniref:peptidoglycan-binding protein n=1 Tax=Tissierella sp. MB52-C2 TaxID=3070999 RepID=UPI00280AFEE1|nr:peptidoglycan-binding protein [Tissierella sp. MB52-C2]WMM25637.1 peptidoglycan-binding protein [Tissierella sp. MB52-C2]
MKKRRITSLMLAATIALTPATTLGHPGKTDSNGGHKDNKNKSGLGSYHYHCGGNPAHLHSDGVCPYSSSSAKSSTSSTKKSSTSTADKKAEIKKIQEKLNELGYDCGKADGIAGEKTKEAIKAFQKDNGLTADRIAGTKTKETLGI